MKRATGLERAELFRNRFHFLGQNVELHTMYIGSEPYLISIHDNVVCAQDVKFITHDISCFRVANYLGIPHNKVDKVGKIVCKKDVTNIMLFYHKSKFFLHLLENIRNCSAYG